MPISIVDLGLVEKIELQPSSPACMDVRVKILPTFVGCTALPMIENEIRRCVSALPGVTSVEVQSTYSPPWSVDRITPSGRESLRRYGVTVPEAGEENVGQPPSCPFCGSATVRQESAFGPTRCRMIWYCESCRHPFEHLKRLATTGLIDLSLQRLPETR
ncbi:MAG: phenylacetate-CoA oxygenase subunit PaaJ [Planctomycetes bacterium]|nr:phenylacetate-CoA oxygenase subunit PaaJ [Planctomycetota bacterium]